jgi:hypothetical protein
MNNWRAKIAVTVRAETLRDAVREVLEMIRRQPPLIDIWPMGDGPVAPMRFDAMSGRCWPKFNSASQQQRPKLPRLSDREMDTILEALRLMQSEPEKEGDHMTYEEIEQLLYKLETAYWPIPAKAHP